MKVPIDLIEKYNVPVPRYTSYPPANFFTNEFNNSEFIETLNESNNQKPENISIYIHIPFCPKICFYCGCNAHVARSKEQMYNYVEAIKKEILMVRSHLKSTRKVSQVHWGGGTPNSLPSAMVREIMDIIHANFTFIDQPEIAMECHPALLTSAYIQTLVDCGFNRFSLGIQDFNKEVLDNVNRDASIIPVEELVNLIRGYKNTSVNLDFIYGLPFQDEKSFADTISRAIEISPDRLVTFSYAHVPWVKKAQKILEKKGLPEADKKMAMFETGFKLLTQNGYNAIGLDHFAKANDELTIALNNRTLHRNFQGYCTRETTGQVYAFGTTGISQLENAYAQNSKNTNDYIEKINRGEFTIEKGYRVNDNEKIVRQVINEIMCNYYVSWNWVAQQYNSSEKAVKELIQYNNEILDSFATDQIISYNENELTVTDKGKFFVRNIAAAFDPNLKSNTKKFSKAL